TLLIQLEYLSFKRYLCLFMFVVCQLYNRINMFHRFFFFFGFGSGCFGMSCLFCLFFHLLVFLNFRRGVFAGFFCCKCFFFFFFVMFCVLLLFYCIHVFHRFFLFCWYRSGCCRMRCHI